MIMTLTLQTVEANLKQAEADVEFWKQAKRVLSDPRMAVAATASVPRPIPNADGEATVAYGDVKQAVYELLPEFGGTAIGTSALVGTLLTRGFKFRAKHHQMAVIDALSVLESDGKAFMARRDGIAKLWTKGKSKEPTE